MVPAAMAGRSGGNGLPLAGHTPGFVSTGSVLQGLIHRALHPVQDKILIGYQKNKYV
jgi:hypothetical protein